MCCILAVADDMTGALEVGAKLAEFGTIVTSETELDVSGQKAIVMDTETRHVSGAEAAAKIYRIAHKARERQIEIVYKKTDSTLRGNIGPEIHAISRASPERAIVFVPAYPQLGRTVRGGYLHLEGELVHRTAFARDALNPVATSYVPDVIGEVELPCRLHPIPAAGRLTSGEVHIFDSETDADIAAVVKVALAESPLPVFCGPGSLASCLAAALGRSDAPAPLPLVTNAVVVNGSRHELAEQQIRCAENVGWPVLSPHELLSNPTKPGWTIMTTDGPADRMGPIVRDVLSGTRVDCLVVFGGDTAYAILGALGVSTIIPVCELLPGVPLSRVGRLQLVTKAGGFGPVDLLPRIREMLSGGR